MEMKMIDKRGSVVIPHKIRKQLELKHKDPVIVKVEGSRIIIEKALFQN